jgi:DNA-directed DNA polymerase III PolC
MRIAALVCRSYYSLLRGSVPAQRWVSKAGEYGYGAIALTDVNAMYGVADFCRSAEQAGIKPVVGAEILTDAERVTLLVKSEAGYRNLCRIITARNLDADFNLIEQLKNLNEGLICICDQHHLLKTLRKIFDEDNLFAGCPGPAEVEWAMANKIKPVAYTNFNYLEESDIAIAELLHKIRRLSVAGPGPEDNRGSKPLIPEEKFKQTFENHPKAVSNAEQIVQRCNFHLLNGSYYLPKVKLPNGKNADAELAGLCHRGLAKKYKFISNEVVKRLEHELAVIRKNKFSDYFLVVHRIVDFAKQERIPVEVRGSAAGSLVSHVLGFTRVCPIENRLYFERFMNPGRKDCPDIDVDFCWRRRDDVIRFCYDNWGQDYVAMVSNINRYRRRSAIRDVARASGVEPCKINRIVEQRKANADSAIYKLAEQIIGFPRHLGVHCGGIVITPRPVRDIAPLELAAKGVIVTQYDKDAAEAVGLIKIDLLGNRSLSTVNEAVTIISRNSHFLNIDAVNSTDEKTAKMLSKGDSLGVFQCESPGMRQLLRGLTVKNRKDLALALSLIRPGPASGGTKAEFIERYLHGKPFTYLHPRMKEVLGDTCGVMLYQEDVMRIAVEVAGYSIGDADKFRSEVSKKVSALRLQKQYEDFVYYRAGGAGMDRQTAEAIWDQILRFAAYSYCKAHATVYANIAWQTAFLKANYAQSFYTSLLNNHLGMYPLRVYVWDAIRHGIKVLPPHVNKSDIEWTVEDRAIRAGLNIVKGLSFTTINAIIEQRKIRPFIAIHDLRKRIRFRKSELENLIRVGACDGLGKSRPAMLGQLYFTPVNPNQMLLFDINKNLSQLPEYSRIEKLKAEVDITDVPFSLHPTVLFHAGFTSAATLNRFLHEEVTVAGFIATARRARTNDGRIMGFVTLEDSSGLAEVTFFPNQIAKYDNICTARGPVWATGKVTEHLSSIAIECRDCGRAA